MGNLHILLHLVALLSVHPDHFGGGVSFLLKLVGEIDFFLNCIFL